MLDEMDYTEKLQNEAIKTAIAIKKAAKAMPNGIMESYAEPIQAEVIMMEDKAGKLTDAEVKEAERLMESVGEIETNASKIQGYGLSRRAFYKELQKVMEVADVVLQVLDARDPEGCRSVEIEAQCVKEGKKLIQVINKIDLVPSQNSRGWQRCLSSEYPVVLFKADYQGPKQNASREAKEKLNKSIGSSSKIEDPVQLMTEELMKVLRKVARDLKTDEKNEIAVAVVGYPNVGKSSVINALKHSRACAVNNLPGTTK